MISAPQVIRCRACVPAIAAATLLLSASVFAQDQVQDETNTLTAAGSDEYLEDRSLDPAILEEKNAVIGKVVIRSDNVFDLDNPLEDKLLYRWANALHVVPRPTVTRPQLLFTEGDRYSKRITEESERLLRQNAYLNDVTIEPVTYENGIVDLSVHTKDVWTLTPNISAGRAGGENNLGIGVRENNLFGTGVLLGVKVKRNVDRDTATLDYSDRNFLGSRYRLTTRIGENSDGYDRRLLYAKPFFALDSRSSGGFSLQSEERIDPLYERGEIISNFNHKLQHHEAFGGWSRGLQNGWAHRYFAGLVYDEHLFAETPDTIEPDLLVPPDREFLYPFFGFEVIQDRFEEGVNFDQIGRVEDRFLGTRFAFRLGYSSSSAGSNQSAWHYSSGFSNALINNKRNSLVLGGNLNGRYAEGEAQNALLSLGARYHRRLTEQQLLYVSLTGATGHNLDLDNQLLLGGDTGLRGYPLRYQGGDSKVLLTLEHRLFTKWYPFQLFNVGGAIFFDAGRTWGENPVGGDNPNLGVLKDVGFGLRLGSSRSIDGRILHIDLAFPLDGEESIDRVQLLIDAKSSF